MRSARSCRREGDRDGRDPARVETLVARLPRARGETADLASLAETGALARSVGAIDVLINNAGVGSESTAPRGQLPWPELRFAVDYLTPGMLVTKLDRVRCVVNVASAGQLVLDFDDLMSEPSDRGRRGRSCSSGTPDLLRSETPARADAQAYDEAARRTLRERTAELLR